MHQYWMKLLPALSYPNKYAGMGGETELTCEFLLASVPNTCFQIFQLDLNFLVISQSLFALPPAIRSRTVPSGPGPGTALAKCCVAAKDTRDNGFWMRFLLNIIFSGHQRVICKTGCVSWRNHHKWAGRSTRFTHPATSGGSNFGTR